MNLRNILLIITLSFCSCGKPDPAKAPIIDTPAGAKVNLSKVSMVVSNAHIALVGENKHALKFDYTVHNQSGAHIRFLCLYDRIDELIEVNLTDKEDEPVMLGKRPMEGLTLTEPRPLRIPNGGATHSYTVPLTPGLREKGDPITLRVRLHAPSRYDELRSSVEAPRIQVLWP